MSLELHVKRRIGSFQLDVELEERSGILGLLGASGSGKSMTLQTIAGIMRPDEGYIVLNNRMLYNSATGVSLPPQQRKTGYVFQNYALFPNMTIAQNIACGIRKKMDRKSREELVARYIADMRLYTLEKRKPDELSGGQQQRAALARALIGEPDILLLDEPFNALDSYLKEQLLTEVRTLLGRFEKDVVLVSHSRDEIYELCDFVAIMENGRVIGAGNTKEVFADPGTKAGAVLTGCKNVTPARKSGAYLVDVPEWGVSYKTEKKVRDDLCAIGVRAHYYGPAVAENAYPVKIVETVEEPFAWIQKFRYENQKEDSAPLWWRVPKNRRGEAAPGATRLGVASEYVLLLYN